jgi:hypothetical protein
VVSWGCCGPVLDVRGLLRDIRIEGTAAERLPVGTRISNIGDSQGGGHEG